jgi:hypothetical protein
MVNHLYIDPTPYHTVLPELSPSWRFLVLRTVLQYVDLGMRTVLVASLGAGTASLVLIGLCKHVDFGSVSIYSN